MTCFFFLFFPFVQIENEYGNIDSAYGSAAKSYINWAATMAISLDTGVPWVMCQQANAPDPIVSSIPSAYMIAYQQKTSYLYYPNSIPPQSYSYVSCHSQFLLLF